MRCLKDITRLKLRGYTLIEASAGTGKTFTITSIYLRLVMEEALMPEQILVVTFTNAATEELQAKVRTRLDHALTYLDSSLGEPDHALKAAVDDAVSRVGRDEVRRRLRLALLSMDQASIFTIHGFCHRVLKEFSFEADSLSGIKNVVMDKELYLPASREFLRSTIAGLDDDFIGVLVEIFDREDPTEFLCDNLEDILGIPEPLIVPEVDFDSMRKEYAIFKKAQSKAMSLLPDVEKIIMEDLNVVFDGYVGEISEGLGGETQKKLEKKSNEWLKKWLQREKDSFKALFSDQLPSYHQFESACHSAFFTLLPEDPRLGKLWLLRNLFEKITSESSVKKGESSWGKLVLDDFSYRRLERVCCKWFSLKEHASTVTEARKRITDFSSRIFPLLNHFGIRERFLAFLLHELREFSKGYMAKKKREMDAISYDDMVRQVHAALLGPKGQSLSAILRSRFKVALIDEFQDTDAIQWEIFRNIYNDPQKSRLFLIGDPKQAIYSFRSADIFTYLKAKSETRESARWDLETNWRSAPALVEGVNTIFSQAQRPFVLEGIDFFPVAAREENDWKLELAVKDIGSKDNMGWESGIEMWMANFTSESEEIAENKDKDENAPSLEPSKVTASKISRIIELSRKGHLVFAGPEGQRREVTPGDIAVLVRSHKQAGLIRDALYELGIPSIYQGPTNIFTSLEARELLYILNAVLVPFSRHAVSTALCTTALSHDAEALIRVQNDEEQWDALVDSFLELKQVWNTKGVMSMLRSLFNRFDVPRRLLSLSDGQRRLTNFRQLSELLSEAERENPGPSRVLLWLKKAIDEPGVDKDEKRLRLETDENLVKVMTYHTSKGLEFPIVFLPYIDSLGVKGYAINKFYSKEQDSYVLPISNSAFVFHQEGEGGHAEFLMADSEWDFAMDQLVAEDVRLIYVALTRAKYKMYLGFFEKFYWRSVVWQLMFPDIEELVKDELPVSRTLKKGIEYKEILSGLFQEEVPAILKNALAGYSQDVEGLTHWCSGRKFDEEGVECEILTPLKEMFPSGTCVRMLFREDLRSIVESGKRIRSIHKDFGKIVLPKLGQGPLVKQTWGKTSFSGLVASGHQGDVGVLFKEGLDNLSQSMDMAGFPRGPRPGNCVHKIFEEIDFAGSLENFRAKALESLKEFNLDTSWAEVLADMVRKVVSSEIYPGLKLKELDPRWIIKEMDFHLACEAEFWREFQGQGIDWDKGILKGYIDLVFSHDERFFLLDYKTNWLGTSPEDYGEKNLSRAMDEHNYWLQAAIYLAALDGYLSRFNQNYDRDRDLGGVFYLFVRGVTGGGASRGRTGVIFVSPDELSLRYPWLFRA